MHSIFVSLLVLGTCLPSLRGQSLLCMMTRCGSEVMECFADQECAEVLTCLGKCDPEDAECSFTCGMGGDAGKNPHFTSLMSCIMEHGCMPRYEESGACLAEDSEALDTVDFSLVAGDWWTVYGQSCGQTDEHGTWTGAYDWYPCSHARFLQLEDDSWINNTTYCPGTAEEAECGGVLVTAPQVYWSSPGVLRHDYPQSEAPIVPQIEDWKWMWVSEDNLWAVVVWCGSNPMLEYNGAFLLHRQRSDGTIPTELEPVIREQLAKYGMNLDNMCLVDSTGCSV